MSVVHEVKVEVAGPLAMFRKPDSGSECKSYPAPTFSAVKGIFESILFLKGAVVRPFRVNICRMPTFVPFSFNYTSGPDRKETLIANGNAQQVSATVLTNVVYQLYAKVGSRALSQEELAAMSSEDRRLFLKVTDHAHSYAEQLNRRIKLGQCWRRVCLGWSAFLADYVGPFRPESQPCADYSESLPQMLKHPFTADQNGTIEPSAARSYQNVQIRNGVLIYA
jgi:CRISPR-associated protein Cas5d